MSSSERTVVVTAANGQAELLLVNSDFKVVARGPSPLTASVPIGLYAAKCMVGDEGAEVLVRIAEGSDSQFIDVPVPRFESPVPLAATSTSHEYHVAAVSELLRPGGASLHLGVGAEIALCVRDPSTLTPRGPADSKEAIDYAAGFKGFRILDGAGSVIADLEEVGKFDLEFGYLTLTIAITPGPYVLAHVREDHSICIPLPTAEGWTLQCFINLIPGPESGTRVPDLADLSLLYGRMEDDFDPYKFDVVILETVRKGLLDGRAQVGTPVMQDLLHGKFENPMLGLYALHLLLREQTPDQHLVRTVLHNSSQMLGPDHPDVVAISCHYLTRFGVPFNEGRPLDLLGELRLLKGPPLLLRSWDMLLNAADAVPQAVPESPAFSIASNLVDIGLFLKWQVAGENALSHQGLEGRDNVDTRVDIRDIFQRGVEGLKNFPLDHVITTAGVALRSVLKDVRLQVRRHGHGDVVVPPDAGESVSTAETASAALRSVARQYDWAKLVPEIRRQPDWLAKLTGLQGDLVFLFRDVAGKNDAIEAMDASFVEKILQARRVPLFSLVQAIEDLELGGWAASELYRIASSHEIATHPELIPKSAD